MRDTSDSYRPAGDHRLRLRLCPRQTMGLLPMPPPSRLTSNEPLLPPLSDPAAGALIHRVWQDRVRFLQLPWPLEVGTNHLGRLETDRYRCNHRKRVGRATASTKVCALSIKYPRAEYFRRCPYAFMMDSGSNVTEAFGMILRLAEYFPSPLTYYCQSAGLTPTGINCEITILPWHRTGRGDLPSPSRGRI